MKPYNIYLSDFGFRLMYCFFSYLVCWGLLFTNSDLILLFEVTPLIYISGTKRLILTQITQLFNAIWFYSMFLSSIFIFPLVIYHIKSFNTSGWYNYQLKFYKISLGLWFLSFIIFYLICHYIIIPNILSFFLFWEITDENSLLRIEAEISLFYYIIWSLVLKFTFTWFLSSVFLLSAILFPFLSINNLYKLFLRYKKLGFFFFISFLFFLLPPDFIIQILLIVIVYFFVELFFLLVCIKFYNKIIKLKIYADHKTIT